MVGFEHVGPDQFAVRVPDRRPGGLTSYESQVYDHVHGLASGGVVPCEALTTGPENESKQWWKRFRTAVSEDARERGLSRPRWARAHLLVLGVLAVAPAGLAAGAFAALPSHASSSKSDDNPVLGVIFVAVVLWTVLMAIPQAMRAERDTPPGSASAARWLGLRKQLGGDDHFADQPPGAVAIWDRLLAYGAAMGVAPGAVRILPMGAESETEAWTAYGGRWRVVHVRYPQRFPPGWGRSAAAAVALLTRQSDGAGRLIAVVFFAAPLLALAYGADLLWRGVADIGRRAPVEGQVLRRREVHRNNDSGAVAVYLAVYGGKGSDVRALRCTPAVASGVDAGELVRATISPHLGHVYSVERLGPMVSTQTGS